MFSNKRMVVICDFTTRTDPATGDKIKLVDNAEKVLCSKELVGVQTQQLGQVQNMKFRYALVIDMAYYHNQKYVYLENSLYTIETLTKGKRPQDCNLIVSELQDKDTKRAIEKWLENN